jgi:hypothetical protein
MFGHQPALALYFVSLIEGAEEDRFFANVAEGVQSFVLFKLPFLHLATCIGVSIPRFDDEEAA